MSAAPATEVAAPRRTPLQLLRAVDGVTWAVIGIAIAALVMRVIGLGDRALHHDESLHAMYSWYFSEGRGYKHDPLMHGPLQFHVIAGFFTLFGDSDTTARLPHAIAGSGLVLTPLLFRRWLGGTGVVLAATFFALSPALLYYSRFARNDVPVALFAMLIFAGIARYRDDGRLRWLALLAAGFALSFASKETTYLTAAIVLLYLDALLAHELFAGSREEQPPIWRRAMHALWLIPIAWLFAALWEPLAPLRRRLGFEERPRSADLLVVTGTLVLPLLAAFILIPYERAFGAVSEQDELTLGTLTVVALLGISTGVGVLWDPRRWLIVAGVFFAILLPLYSTFGTHTDGVAGAFWTSLAYWMEQHDVQRGNQPWFYYLMLVPFYETLTLVAALIGGTWLIVKRTDGFATMVLFWALATWFALSAAGEKMPWLTVHIALPLALLAAYVLGRALPAALAAFRERRGGTLAWASAGAAVWVGAVLIAHMLWTDINLNVRHPDTPVEPLIYVQSSPDVPVLAREIKERLDDGRATGVFVDSTASLSWPWAWYLRGEPAQYGSADFLREGNVSETSIVIAAGGTLPPDSDVRDAYAEVVPYVHRWWFPEEYYRSATVGRFIRGVLNGSWPNAWVDFAVNRISEDRLGTLPGEVLFP